MPTAHSTLLNENWRWRQRDITRDPVAQTNNVDEQWHRCASFPSDIHRELQAVGRIPDPYLGFNEHKVQWVGEREWLYQTVFDYDNNTLNASKVELQFEGLDTFCIIYLNEQEILKTDNQFTPYVVSVPPNTLKPTGNNLLLHFLSAKSIALELEKNYGRVRAGSVNLGHPSRVYVRKAQYDWRWDWGPELMTAGPYRPIHLKTYKTAISTLYAHTDVLKVEKGMDDASALLSIDLTLSGDASVVYSVEAVVLIAGGTAQTVGAVEVARKEATPLPNLQSNIDNKNVLNWQLSPGEVELWWPVGYGGQPLYDVEVTIKDKNGQSLDTCTHRVGFRTVELVQESYDPATGDHAVLDRFHHGEGSTFYFRVNGVPIFIGGSNWIPADNFLTSITPERYRAWLELLKDGNQNMVRVWGGGVYEPDVFYDICDELGILVWQDFQFACGVYPAHEDFVKSVRIEAQENVKRLRRHPSIVLWCGNNEDYQQVLQWGGINDLPARKLYEEVLPEVIASFTNPPAPYHRGSPYGGKGWDTSDPTIGDVHQWNVWAGQGLGAYYQNFDELGGRFVSEFGMPAFPSRRTVSYWMNDGIATPSEIEYMRYSQSKSMQQHNKAGSHERRFAVYINENFRLTNDFDEHIYLTQLLQSEAVSYAYRVWRREWRGSGREYNAGVIVWQLNDCWPVISWAIADYFLRPKPAYYTIRREMAPVTVGIQRTVKKNREHDRPQQFYEFGAFQSVDATFELWGTNSTLSPVNVLVEITYHDLHSDWTHRVTLDQPITLVPNSSTEVVTNAQVVSPPHKSTILSSDTDPLPTNSFSVVVSARFLDPTDPSNVIARYSDWPQPYRILDLPTDKDQGLVLNVTLPSEETSDHRARIVVNATTRPLKGVVLSVDEAMQDGDELKWSDNALDVVPGDPQTVWVEGLKTDKLYVEYLWRLFGPVAVV